ncbi:MAG: VCBS repeat-containing protein, partial [Chitinophagaceae bacterium]|nr:VCBS repeat-containing protein [Chitinophagaceae bacterium]
GEWGTGSAQGFIFNSTPLIHSISPATGPVGTTVTIKGANFSSVVAENAVYFPGSIRAEVLSASSNEIKVKSPAGSMFGPITVAVDHKSGVSGENFSTTFPSGALVFTGQMLSQKQDYAARMGNIEISEADFDGDGRLDIFTVNNQGNVDERSVSVWQNLSSAGKILLGDPQTFIASNNPMSAIAADINGDGKPELVVANQTSYTVGVYKNTSSGGAISLEAPVTFPMGPAIQLASGDIDGDGRIDLVTANFYNEFSVMRNTSGVDNISFDPQFYVTFAGYQKRIALNDLNKDGRPEIIVTNSTEDIVNIYPNASVPGAIILGEPVTYLIGDGPYHGLVVADIDGNGWMDIIAANTNSNAISVLKNVSGKLNEFAPFTEFPLAKKPMDMNATDLDGDGKLDFVTVDYESQQLSFISMIKNVSANPVTLRTPLTVPADRLLSGSCLGDLDGDGKPDIAVTNPYSYVISIYKNKSGDALILSSGDNAVTGEIVQEVAMDSSVNSYQGRTYVQRHYHIEPENNPGSATATVTLYFSQQDFNNYNAASNHGNDLPTGASDVAGISNLLVLQYHGTSVDNQPAGYSGDTVMIDPDDSKIVWNDTTGLWEITFDVKGFSGFFVTTENHSPPGVDEPVLLGIYPNPASQFITIKHDAASEHSFIRVADINGRNVINVRLVQGSTQTRLDVRKLLPGIYAIAIHDGRRKRVSKMVVY